jgi:hypothetical protein
MHGTTNLKLIFVRGVSHYGPGVDSASNKNEYQECFLGVKAACAQGSQPCHLHVLIVMKSRSLNLLEPSEPVKACNGISLLYVVYLFNQQCMKRVCCCAN